MPVRLPKNGILSEGKTLLLVFLLALVIRTIFVSTLQDGYYFADSARFETAARHILAEGSYPAEFDRAPLYPAFLAAVYSTLGEEIIKTRIVQTVMSSLLAAAMVLLGFRIGGYWVGAFAGVLWAIYPMGVFVASTIYPATLLALLLAAGVLLLLPRDGLQAGMPRLISAGFIFGLCALAKPVVLAATAAVALWIAIVFRERRLSSAIVFIVMSLLAITPWTIRNFEIHDRLVPIEARNLNKLVPWTQSKEERAEEFRIKRQAAAAIKQGLTGQKNEKLLQALEESSVSEIPSNGAVKTTRVPLTNLEKARAMAARFPGEFVSFFELYPRRVGFLEQEQRDRARAGVNPRLVKEIPFGSMLVMAVSAFSVSFLYLFALLGIRAMWLSTTARAYLGLCLLLVFSFAAGYATSWGKIRYRVPVDPYIILLSAWGIMWAWQAAADKWPVSSRGEDSRAHQGLTDSQASSR